MTINEAVVLDGVKAHLEDELDLVAYGDGESPDLSEFGAPSVDVFDVLARKTQGKPMAIIFPLPESSTGRGFAGFESMLWVPLQFTVLGVTPQQVRHTSAMIVATLLNRVLPIPIDGHAVIDRQRAGSLPIEGPSADVGALVHGGCRVRLLVQVSP